MYILLISPWLNSSTRDRQRRAGGGGGGAAGGGGGGGGKSGGATGGGGSSGGKSGGMTGGGGSTGSKGGGVTGGGGSTGSKGGGVTGGGGSTGSGSTGTKGGGSPGPGSGNSIPLRSPSGSTSNANPYGSGSKATPIPVGQPFGGRSIGGGTRDDVFGNRRYGSGYPGTRTPGVTARGFPFGFWPITFGAGVGLGLGIEYDPNEYGDPSNSSRPGGPLYDAPFQPLDRSNTYRILSDNATVHSLIDSIKSNCSLSTTSISAAPYNTSDPFHPKPEQVIQYYRSSSISLTLDGYNNSAVFSNDSSALDTALPSGLNATFLDCLNQTIGAAAPILEDAALTTSSGSVPTSSISFQNAATQRAPVSGLMGLLWVAIYLLRHCS